MTSSSRSNLGGGAALGWRGSHLRSWSADVRSRPLLCVGAVTQLDTQLARLPMCGIGARQLSSPGLEVVSFGESSVADEGAGDAGEGEEVVGFAFVASVGPAAAG